MIRSHTSYLERAFDPDDIAETIQKMTKRRKIEFDTVVGTGMSGCLVLPIIARNLECNFYAVRKENDGSHSSKKGEGVIGNSILFVDDLIDTGATMYRVLNVIGEVIKTHNRYAGLWGGSDKPHYVNFAGVFCYGSNLIYSEKGFNRNMGAEGRKVLKAFYETQRFDWKRHEAVSDDYIARLMAQVSTS